MKFHRLLACIALFAFAPFAFAQMTPTHRTTADGRPLASSKPATAAGRAQSRPIQFQELAQHVDAKVIVTTEYGDHKEGRIVSVSGSTLHLKTSVVGGYAVTNFEKNHIRSITLLP